jgi:hypothetical protein
MSNVLRMVRKTFAANDAAPLAGKPSDATGESGGGGSGPPPHNGAMEARVIKLEEFAKEAGERLARVETRLEHIDKEVSNTKWWVAGSTVTIILAMVGTVLGTGVAIQQMTASTFQAAGQQAAPAAQPPIIINVPAAPLVPPAAPGK